MRLALVVVVGVILYGSLFPFDFTAPPADVAAALSIGLTEVRRGDALANLLLYIPLGLLLVVGKREGRRGGRILAAVVLGFCLSLTVEVAQLWLPPRITSLSDLGLNTAGSFLGAVLGLAAARVMPGRRDGASRQNHEVGLYGLLLMLAFLGWQGAPFVPSIDWQAWKDSLKPLLTAASLSPSGMLAYVAAWLGVGLVAAGLVRPVLVAPLLAGLTLAVCAGKVLVISRVVTPELLLTGLAVATAWALAPTRKVVAAPGVVAAVLAVFIAWDGLAEAWAQRVPGGAPFHWIPFRGFLTGSMVVNVLAMFEKVFLYGTLVLALLRMGAPALVVGSLAALLLLAVEGLQALTGGRTAEITDPLLAVILTALAVRLGEGRRSLVSSQPRQTPQARGRVARDLL